MVVQLIAGGWLGNAAMSGPPALPSGSMVPVIEQARLGSVGPITEQK